MLQTQRQTSDNSITGQLRSLIRDIGVETVEGIKETGKEVLKGVTMLSSETVMKAKIEDLSMKDQKGDSDWAKEWLGDKENKDKISISQQEGGHSNIDAKKTFAKQDKQKFERIGNKIQQSLHRQYSQVSPSSQYGQRLAEAEKAKQKSVYEKNWEEREQQKQITEQQQKSVGLPQISGKRKRGDWMHGIGKKKQSAQEINRSEFVGGKGKH